MTTHWNVRTAHHSHYQRFSRLVDIHALTGAWLSELKVERAPYLIERAPGRRLADQVWMLESLSEGVSLDGFLDDTSIDDVLGRLERLVWSAQAYTLSTVWERAAAEERQPLLNVLEQTAWKLGRASAEKRWSTLPEEARQDLRTLVFATAEAPFFPLAPSGSTGSPPFLTKRALREEMTIELFHCPHQRGDLLELAGLADLLCDLQAQWIRGFAYSLNHRVVIDKTTPPAERIAQGRRCELHWRIVRNQTG